jgi:uncharacterized protein YdhG (YjbR/CyaY superfamily)
VPKAEEYISYQFPAFRLDGKCFVWFGAAANHCAIYGVLGDHKDELKDYDISKGTIRFQADKTMPAALVKKLIKTPIAENVGRSNKARNVGCAFARRTCKSSGMSSVHISCRVKAPRSCLCLLGACEIFRPSTGYSSGVVFAR